MVRRSRVDENQRDVVKELKDLGLSVVVLSDVGEGVPDLLVGIDGFNFLFEVKQTEGGILTPAQTQFFQDWKGHKEKCHNTGNVLWRLGRFFQDHGLRYQYDTIMRMMDVYTSRVGR